MAPALDRTLSDPESNAASDLSNSLSSDDSCLIEPSDDKDADTGGDDASSGGDADDKASSDGSSGSKNPCHNPLPLRTRERLG